MVRVCAWCGCFLGGDQGEGGEITHGICPDCLRAVREEGDGRISLPEFLERLGVPVLLVDDDVRVRAANPLAASLLGKEVSAVEGAYGGEVIECGRSRLPEGCGRTLHCRACTLRNTVTDTFRTGQSHHRVEALADRDCQDGASRIRFLISTERVGRCVLLRIDEVGEAPAACGEEPET